LAAAFAARWLLWRVTSARACFNAQHVNSHQPKQGGVSLRMRDSCWRTTSKPLAPSALSTQIEAIAGMIKLRRLPVGERRMSASGPPRHQRSGATVLVIAPDEIEAAANRAIALQTAEKTTLARLTAGEKLPDITGVTAMLKERMAKG
jgi:hypothetical protein